MSAPSLRALAERAGLQLEWEDAQGHPHAVGEATQRELLTALGLPCDGDAAIAASLASLEAPSWPTLATARIGEAVVLETLPLADGDVTWRLVREDGATAGGSTHAHGGRVTLPAVDAPGYHRLDLANASLTLAVAPAHAWSVADACGDGARVSAAGAQLYALRRGGEVAVALGSGDFGALAPFCAAAGERGFDAVAISPVHAGFAAEPHHFSPYSPSTRLFVNVLAIDPCEAFGEAAVLAALESLGLVDEQRRLEGADLVDWPAVGTLRLALLRALAGRGLAPDQESRFAAWRLEQGEALEHHAMFEALHAVRYAAGEFDWRRWPSEWRDPDGPAVRAFAAEHAEEVSFHARLQWLASCGLAAAQRAARDAGMRIGIVGDLAVGTDPAGSHAWSRHRELLSDVSVGAPPDALSPTGQDWGLTSLSPTGLKATGYRAFIELLRAAMANVGGLRIDHVLGFNRLWLIPRGRSSAEGAYLRFPFEDMARLVALESWRHRAIVIGENLGTVPGGFNERIARAGILGIDVLWFKRDWRGDFVDPRQWDRNAVATTTTHDLPTVEGWWVGREIEWRAQLGQLGAGEDEARLRRERRDDRTRLLQAIGVAADPAAPDRAPLDAIIAFVARSPSPLVLIPIEDLLGLVEQPNIPGTTTGHPNWRRRLPCRGVSCFESAPVERRIERLLEARKG